ncbi:MAG: hypothetical protein PHX05_02025 [Acidobacteriota bacterium]|nr:hypothetical protein [Acidobacteriota bacterium]
MKKAICSVLLLIAAGASGICQQGAEALVAESASFLAAFFKDMPDARVAVVRFENDSELTDLAMQKIYQMLVSRLEGEKNFRVLDLLLDFTGGRGEFNLDQPGTLDFLIEMKLIQNKSRTGLGLTVFSRLQDRVVAVKYFERPVSKGEMDLLNTRSYAFSGLGFSKLLEFESRMGLMDIQSISAEDGQEQYFFYYPDEIIIYSARETRLEKHFQFKLFWKRPVYPVLHPEGKLLLFRLDRDLVLTAGNNFSPTAQVLTYRDGQWQESRKIEFVPFRFVTLNQTPYLVGARYEEGRNFFKDRVYFQPFSPAASGGANALEKKTCPAMSLDFSSLDGQLQGVHVIDRSYSYRLFTSDFEEKKPLPEKKGASLAASGGEWLAVSDYSRNSDQLFFYDIRDGGLRQVYAGKVSGEIQFISAGSWLGTKGFWAGVRQQVDGLERLMVQFWGKSNE